MCDGSGACDHPNSGLCGACCLANKDCIDDVLAATCAAQGGTHQGAGSVCAGDSDGDGTDDLCDNCAGVDDNIFGVRICSASGSPCQSTAECPQGEVCKKACIDEIPTVSQWGLIVLAISLLAASKVYFGSSSANGNR